jgi:hypothetical protein
MEMVCLQTGTLPKTNDLSRRFRENSLKQHCEGHIPGMLRLCARPASGTRAPLSTTDRKSLVKLRHYLRDLGDPGNDAVLINVFNCLLMGILSMVL